MRNLSVTYTATFKALADPTRRAVLDLLLKGKLPAGQIAQAFPVSRPAISKHLRILRGARLVRMQRAGRRRLFEIDLRPLEAVDSWLCRYRAFWQNELSHLKEFVEAAQAKERPGQRNPVACQKRGGRKHAGTTTKSKLR